MKTLKELYLDWWSIDGLNTSTHREAFMAGAAAMAEIFASGQALKIREAPRKYLITWEFAEVGKEELQKRQWLVLAFNSDEAFKQAGFTGNIVIGHGIEIRPATVEDEKIEGVIHV